MRQSQMLDIYGQLLTDHQRQVYEDVVYGDLSLSEAADAHSISRQGIHDLVKRCDRILEGYEEKLRILEKNKRLDQLLKSALDLAVDQEQKELLQEALDLL